MAIRGGYALWKRSMLTTQAVERKAIDRQSCERIIPTSFVSSALQFTAPLAQLDRATAF